MREKSKNRKVKILIANSSYIADHGGGEKKGLLEQAKCFRSMGYEVDILTLDVIKDALGDFKEFKIIKAGIPIRTFLPIRHVFAMFRYLTIPLEDYDQIWANEFPAIILALRHNNVSTYTFGPNHLLAMRKEYYLDKLPFIIRQFGRVYVDLLTKLDKFLMKRVKNIVAISNSVKEKTAEYYGRDDAIVIHLGVHNPAKVNPKFKKFIFCPSRLVAAKRIDKIVESMKYLPDYELYIAGKGSEEEKLRRLAGENRLKVKFLGFMPLKDLSRYYLDCFCVAYIPINEDFGMVPIEAQSYGKMVIGANEGGEKETIIHGKTGFLLDDVTAENIAKSVREIEEIGPETRVKECIENAKRFDWKNFHRRFEGVMERIE